MISYTPLRYPGGKGKLYPFVKKIIENNYENKPAYAEPYAGGFGLGMKLLINEKVSRVYINDLDFSIYVFWKEIIENTENFIEKIINTNIDINEWKKQKERRASKNGKSYGRGEVCRLGSFCKRV